MNIPGFGKQYLGMPRTDAMRVSLYYASRQ
jgi:hypothetical protein